MSFSPLSQPRYPEAARARGEQGIVGIRVFVGLDGKVERAEIGKSSGYKELDDSALAETAHWRLQPGTIEGVHTAMWTCFALGFSVKPGGYQLTPRDLEDMRAFNQRCTESAPKLPPLDLAL